jgi:murein DD-endopeptidase MepM/ murein hydrolase activator NlpD
MAVVGAHALATPRVGPAAGQSPPAPEYGSYEWPVRGPVLREFEQPPDPYAPGHRGIDIGVALGTPVVAPKNGVVAFAGWVGGSLFVSVDHPDGVRTTYSWLTSVAVQKGDVVDQGFVIATSGHGHAEVLTPHLHFGARIGVVYIDPMLLLEGASVVGLIHLAPLDDSARSSSAAGCCQILGAAVARGPPRMGALGRRGSMEAKRS